MIAVTVAIPALLGFPGTGMTQTIEATQRGATSAVEGADPAGERVYEWRFAGHTGTLVHRRGDGPLALSAALLAAADQVPRFTCPVCWRTSWNPTDLEEGYCGACHDYTGR